MCGGCGQDGTDRARATAVRATLQQAHELRIAVVTAPSSYNDSGKAAIEDEVTDKTYSVCMERNGKFQATIEGRTILSFDKVGNRSSQTFEFNETISLVR